MAAITFDWMLLGSAVARPVHQGEGRDNQFAIAETKGLAADNPDPGKFHFRPSGNWTNNLAIMYATGTGVRQDYVKAAEWYRQAAEKGDANAQYNLGVMYYSGRGVSTDHVEAALWFHKAAERGDADAQFNLGYLKENGMGVPQINAEAER